MNIEIITTANEALKETGFGSINSCQHVLQAIEKMGHQTRLSSCKSRDDLACVVRRKPDLVILAVKYIPLPDSDDIWLSEYFMHHAIAHSGSVKSSLDFDSDKIQAKVHLEKKGVSTAKFFTALSGEYLREDVLPLNYPLFLKPVDAANGNGIDEKSHVSDFDEFESKLSTLDYFYKKPTLVEEYIEGKEFTVALISTKDGEMLVSAVEIVVPASIGGHRILGGKVKSKNTEVLQKITDKKTSLDVKKMALEVFLGLNVEGFARIDIKMDVNGKCFFMEANLVPGMTLGSSYFPEAFRIDLGLSYDQTITHIVEYCLSKNQEIETSSNDLLFSYQGIGMESSILPQ